MATAAERINLLTLRKWHVATSWRGLCHDYTMRKKSREMDSAWALEVMRRAPYMTVSFTRPDGSAYGVPLSLAGTADGMVWYFHCAPEGEKLDAIAAHPEVCLSAVSRCTPTVGPKDGSFTLQYKSAIAFGRAETVTDEAEKIEALRLISERFLPAHMDAFDDAVRRSLHRTAVVRITLSSPPSGKRKQYGPDGEEMKSSCMEEKKSSCRDEGKSSFREEGK